LKNFNYFSIKRKENFFSLFFLAREQKKQWKKVFSFFEHEVLFYETPFLHRAGTIYVCGQSEEVSSSGGLSLF
jgi:hypothetical protein